MLSVNKLILVQHLVLLLILIKCISTLPRVEKTNSLVSKRSRESRLLDTVSYAIALRQSESRNNEPVVDEGLIETRGVHSQRSPGNEDFDEMFGENNNAHETGRDKLRSK